MEEGISGLPRLAALALALAVAALGLVSLVAPEPGVAAPSASGLWIRPRASHAVGMAMVWWE